MPFPSPGDLPSPGVESEYCLFPALPADSLWLEPPGKPASSTLHIHTHTHTHTQIYLKISIIQNTVPEYHAGKCAGTVCHEAPVLRLDWQRPATAGGS